MGTSSKMRKDPLYYKRRRQEKLLRSRAKGSTGKLSELEAYYRGLKFPHMDKCDWGGNRFCIVCKKGNGKNILNCGTSWCTNYAERFTCELKKEEN